ncbi:MAG: ABC transporter permease [Flavobacteriales bacterium]|nr:ABC transporter permease [Flavobacteriales bacterium]
MNTPFFIAKRITGLRSREGYSGPMVVVAISGIALGLAVMILSVGVVRGFRQTIREKIIGFGSHVRITEFAVGNSLESPPMKKDADFVPILLQEDKIKHIQTFAIKPGIIKTDEEIQGVIFKGAGKDFNWHFFEQNLKDGTLPRYTEDSLNISTDIVISNEIAKKLRVGVNDTLVSFFINRAGERNPDFTSPQRPPRKFRIAAIYETGLSDFDEKFILCDINVIRDLNNWFFDKISGYEVLINRFDDLQEVSDYADMAAGFQYKVENVRQLNRAIFDWLEQQDINVIIIITLMLTVGVMGMISALLILILERVQMIGILKTLGMNNQSIRKIFYMRALYILFTGILAGNIVGIGLGVMQQQTGIIKLDKESYYMDTVPVFFDVWGLLGINVLTLAFGLLALILPVFMATRITPLEAIRTD